MIFWGPSQPGLFYDSFFLIIEPKIGYITGKTEALKGRGKATLKRTFVHVSQQQASNILWGCSLLYQILKFSNCRADLCMFSRYCRKDLTLGCRFLVGFSFFPLADLLFLHIENQSSLMHWETLSLKTRCLSLWVILSAKSCEIIIDFKSQQQKYLIFRWQTVKEEPSGSVLNVNEIRFMLG